MASLHLFLAGRSVHFLALRAKKAPNWDQVLTDLARNGLACPLSAAAAAAAGRAGQGQIWPVWARISPILAKFCAVEKIFARIFVGFWAASHVRACTLCVYTLGQIWPFAWSFRSIFGQKWPHFWGHFWRFLTTASGEAFFYFFIFYFWELGQFGWRFDYLRVFIFLSGSLIFGAELRSKRLLLLKGPFSGKWKLVAAAFSENCAYACSSFEIGSRLCFRGFALAHAILDLENWATTFLEELHALKQIPPNSQLCQVSQELHA